MLPEKDGETFALRATPPVLLWFFRTLCWFLLCYVIDGIMLDGSGFRLFLLIFFVKET